MIITNSRLYHVIILAFFFGFHDYQELMLFALFTIKSPTNLITNENSIVIIFLTSF